MDLPAILSTVNKENFMNKILKSIVFTGLLLAGFTSACNLSASQTATATPAPTASVTPTATPFPTATSTEAVPIVSPTSEFAPFCESDSSAASSLPQCRFPNVVESSTFCTSKSPYNLILIDQGMTYEVQTEGFKCIDAGKKDDKQMVTCTGNMASEFEIKVCDPACVVPTAQATNTKCPQDYNYNNLLGCCTNQIQVLNRNCVSFKFKTTTCVVDCSVYTTKSTCNKNSVACFWDDREDVCSARR
jgi:hypothetical protein